MGRRAKPGDLVLRRRVGPLTQMAKETKSSLQQFFTPKSIAIIGASRHPGKIGHEIVRNIKLSGYEGHVYPVNPNAASTDYILGFKAYPSLNSIGSPVDLVVIAVPAQFIEQAIKDCMKNGTKSVIIITSGFSEIGNSDSENKVISLARSAGIRVIGPNTFGIFCAKSKMNCTFGPNYVLSGKTAFITQSGALGLALMSWTTEEKYGVSSIVSIGNKADVDDADLIDYFSGDDSTKSILIYMEGLKNGRKFYESAKEAVKRKPIIVIKSGKSKRGAQAASSHTGSIAGQDIVFSAAFKETGIMRANTMTEAFDWIQAINENPVPHGENLVIVTNGGGIGVLATDECESVGLDLMEIPEDLKGELRSIIPSFGSLRNPIDLTANASDETYRKVLEVLLRRVDVHAVIALFCQTANIDPTLVAEAILTTSRGDKNKSGDTKIEGKTKPIVAAFVGGHLAQAAYNRMIEKKFAAYPTPERAVAAMYSLFVRYRQKKRKGFL
jgi:acetyl-CoA synthetase (ADP-forming)